jgi:porin
MRRLFALALLLIPALASPAAAQTAGPGSGIGLSSGLQPPTAAPPPPGYVAPQVEQLPGDPDTVMFRYGVAIPPPQVEQLLGDLWGVRTYLAKQGIYLLLDFTSEFAANPSGGITQGATFANQVGLELDIDWQRRAGITGLSTHVIFVSRSGYSDSLLIGDNIAPVQEIYGASGNVLVHLVSAYAEQTLLDKRLDIAIGQMNVENDFASSPLYCYSMNNAICGDPKALPAGDKGHSAFPDGVWAGRIRVRPTPDTYAEAGVYEVNQGLYTNRYFGSGFPNNISQASGVYVPTEVAYEPALGANNLIGHYKFGFGYDSTLYKSFFSALPATAGEPVLRPSHNTQVWVLADQMLVRQGAGDQDGIVALAGFAHNDPNVSAFAEQYFAGLVDRGFSHARPEDAVALFFNYNSMSGPLGTVQAEEAELGIPLGNGATGVQTHEMFVEANYNIHVYRGMDFRPEFQYVIRPNGQSNIRDAAVFGFKIHVEF